MSRALFKQVLQPTGVSHCTAAFMQHVAAQAGENSIPNLICVKFTQLQIFAVRVPGSLSSEEVDLDLARLELVGEWSLSGVVESVAVLRSRQPGQLRDSLFLTFRDAKASLVEFDEATSSLRTISLHSWENDNTLTHGRRSFPRAPMAAADPQGRCAAVALFGHQLALLPAEGSDMLDLLAHQTGGAAAGGDGAGPTASSALQTSYVVNLEKALGVTDVVDIAFLRRYNAPVLAVLHEARPSWPGRYRDISDTCQLVVISLDLSARRHTRLWAASSLPSDSFAISATPGGEVLVLSTNYLMFYSQETSFAVALNRHSFSGNITPMNRADRNDLDAEPLAVLAARAARAAPRTVHAEAVASVSSRCDPSTAEYNIELDGATCTWLNKATALLTLKSGRLVTVALKRSGGAPKGFAIHGIGSGSPCSAASRLSEDLLFLGSWSGDSLLVRYVPLREGEATEQADIAAPAAAPSMPQPPPSSSETPFSPRSNPPTPSMAGGRTPKRLKLEPKEEMEVEGGGGDDDDLDDEALYGSSSASARRGSETAADSPGATAQRFSLKVLDSVMCLGPVRDMTVTEAVPAPGPQADETERGDAVRAGLHTIVAVGNDKGGALAVLRRSVLLDVMTDVPIPNASGIWAIHCNPQSSIGGRWEDEPQSYLLISLEAETKVFSCGDELEEITDETCQFVWDAPTVAAAPIMGASAVVQVTAQRVRVVESSSSLLQELGLSDLVAAEDMEEGLEIMDGVACGEWVALRLSNGQAVLLRADESTKQLHHVEGASEPLMTQAAVSPGTAVSAVALYQDTSLWLSDAVGFAPADGPPAFLAVARAGGALEVFALPQMERVFFNADLAQGYRVMVSEETISDDASTQEAAAEALDMDDRVVELCMESFTTSTPGEAIDPFPSPALLAITGRGMLLAFKAFQPANSDIRFKRSKVDWLGCMEGPPPVHGMRPRRMTRFDNIGGGLSGVFVSGIRPAWLVASAGALQAHPYLSDGPVLSMTPFHNNSCIRGMIVLAGLGEATQMKICEMPLTPVAGSVLRLDQQWVTRKVPLSVTPHKVAHFAEEKMVVVLISHPVPAKERLPEEQGGDAHAAAAYATSDAAAHVAGVEEGHEVWFLREGDYANLWKYELNPGEQGMAARAVTLKNINTPAPCQTTTFFVAGTATNLGEDYPCVGRVLLFQVSHDPATGQVTQSRLAYEREFRGPVTAINTLEQCLLIAVGSKLFLHYWDGVKLTEAAFFDSPLLITSVNVIKNFVLIGDVHKGVNFVRYVEKPREYQVANPEREKYRQLLALSKDYDQKDTTATEFIINGRELGLLTADGSQSLNLFQYDNQDAESWRGKRLMPKASFHMGATVRSMLRLKLSSEVNRRAAIMGTTHGSIAALCPLGDAEFAVLSRLQRLMQRRVEQPCGLNPRAFRRRFMRVPRNLGGGEHYGPPGTDAGALDGDLLWSFQWLSRRKQEKLSTDAEASRDGILSILSKAAEALGKMHLETGNQALFL